MEDLKNKSLEFSIIREFLTNLKQEFRNRNDESVKVAKLKKMKQESKTMKNFVQKFRKTARGSNFEGRLLIKEFKREIYLKKANRSKMSFQKY